jgi:hypothetical protein
MNFGCARQAREPEIHLCLKLCGISALENFCLCSGHHAFLSVPCSATTLVLSASAGELIGGTCPAGDVLTERINQQLGGLDDGSLSPTPRAHVKTMPSTAAMMAPELSCSASVQPLENMTTGSAVMR